MMFTWIFGTIVVVAVLRYNYLENLPEYEIERRNKEQFAKKQQREKDRAEGKRTIGDWIFTLFCVLGFIGIMVAIITAK